MTSVASAGTADRIVARIVLSILRAGSGTAARYSATSFGAPFVLAPDLSLIFTFSPGEDKAALVDKQSAAVPEMRINYEPA